MVPSLPCAASGEDVEVVGRSHLTDGKVLVGCDGDVRIAGAHCEVTCDLRHKDTTGRHRETQGDIGRHRKTHTDPGAYRETQGDKERHGECHGKSRMMNALNATE